MSASKVTQRQQKLLEWMKKKNRATLQEIVEQFHCSAATARRDLEALEQSGQLIRTFGGAIYEGDGVEISFSEKQLLHWEEKERIAHAAVQFVDEGDVIGLTGGTTTYFIAKAIKHIPHITVVTNAVNIAVELADSESIQVVMTGGVMRSKSYELCGPLAEKIIGSLNITKMFLGVDGATAQFGLHMYSELENRIAQQLIARARSVYAVFDHTKIGRSSLLTIAPLHQIKGIITDRQPDPSFTDACRQAGVQIHLPRT